MQLPNELLHSIIEYIAYTAVRPDLPSHSLLRRASPELLALSVANWRLRQVCLPLLFANIRIHRTTCTTLLSLWKQEIKFYLSFCPDSNDFPMSSYKIVGKGLHESRT
ncbi:hypothetical protein F5878DRAFT_644331, partial [Lentinula raphanica]